MSSTVRQFRQAALQFSYFENDIGFDGRRQKREERSVIIIWLSNEVFNVENFDRKVRIIIKFPNNSICDMPRAVHRA